MPCNSAEPVEQRTKSERVVQTYGIAVDISVSVQRRTVGNASNDNVLIDKALDLWVVVPRPHVVQTVIVCGYSYSPVKYGFILDVFLYD